MRNIIIAIVLSLLSPALLQAGLFDNFRESAAPTFNPVRFEGKFSNLLDGKPESAIKSAFFADYTSPTKTDIAPVKFSLSTLQPVRKTIHALFSAVNSKLLFRGQAADCDPFSEGYTAQQMYCTCKNKVTAGILAILLGNIGAHHWYLNEPSKGLLCVLFCWTYIPAILGIVDGITYLSMTDGQFANKFCPNHRGSFVIKQW